MKYSILENNLNELTSRISRLNAKTTKIGNSPITITRTGLVQDVPADDQPGKVLRYVEVEVTGEAPVYNGWKFLATICATQEGNVIRSIPGYSVPVEYREGNHTCDHCHTNRFRRDTYIVQHEDGRTMRVGSSCLQDFLQHTTPNKLTLAARYCYEAFDMAEAATKRGWLGGAHSEVFRIDLLSYLAQVAQVVMDSGKFLTRKQAEFAGVESTRYVAEDRFNHDKPVTEEAKTMAVNAREWVLATFSPDFNIEATDNLKFEVLGVVGVNREISDFEHNMLTVARAEAIEPRLMGIAAYIIEAHRRDIARCAPKQDVTLKPGSLTALHRMLDTAISHGLKHPGIRLMANGLKLKLTAAAATSRNPGFLYVKDSDANYVGKISPEGRFFGVSACSPAVEAALVAFATNPEANATQYGRTTGCCCFCGRSLIDARSTSVGYGQICAERMGLRWGLTKSEGMESCVHA